MELKQQASESARKKHHVVKRLAKASQSAQRLEILCGSLSPESLLQSNAYSASMRANEAFERLEYQKSLDLFCSALSFYDTLEKAADPALEPYFQSARDEIEPSVQFLCYSLKVESGKTVDIEQLLSICDTSQVPGLELVSAKINAFIKTSARKTDRQGEPHLLEFIDGPVVVNNRDLVDRLVLIATFKNGIRSSDDPAAFDRLLAMYWDATTFLNALIESDKKMAEKISSSKTQAASESLALASSFIAYGRITTTIGRHMCLLRNPQLIVISHSSKEKLAEERFKLSRAITKCIQEMESLVCFTTSAKFQDLVLFSQGVFEALRLENLSALYTCLGDSRASYLILEEAIKQIENAKRDRMNVEIPSDTVYSLLEILNTIEADVARNLVRAKAQLYISKHKDLAAKKVIGRDAFTFIDTHQSPLLVDPLAMQVIACKPIFYNLALAGVEYPTISVDNANEPVIDADEPGDAPISFLGSVLGGLWGTK